MPCRVFVCSRFLLVSLYSSESSCPETHLASLEWIHKNVIIMQFCWLLSKVRWLVLKSYFLEFYFMPWVSWCIGQSILMNIIFCYAWYNAQALEHNELLIQQWPCNPCHCDEYRNGCAEFDRQWRKKAAFNLLIISVLCCSKWIFSKKIKCICPSRSACECCKMPDKRRK